MNQAPQQRSVEVEDAFSGFSGRNPTAEAETDSVEAAAKTDSVDSRKGREVLARAAGAHRWYVHYPFVAMSESEQREHLRLWHKGSRTHRAHTLDSPFVEDGDGDLHTHVMKPRASLRGGSDTEYLEA